MIIFSCSTDGLITKYFSGILKPKENSWVVKLKGNQPLPIRLFTRIFKEGLNLGRDSMNKPMGVVAKPSEQRVIVATRLFVPNWSILVVYSAFEVKPDNGRPKIAFIKPLQSIGWIEVNT